MKVKTTIRPALGAPLSALAGAVVMLLCASGGVQAQTLKDYYAEFEQREFLATDFNGGGSISGSTPVIGAGRLLLGFEGPSQYNAASFSRNFIPPDTMGAVGLTQYVSTSNGAYAVYDKANGNNLSMVSDTAFWAAAGQTGSNGDTRIMYNAAASRWVAVSFGANVKDLQIAVSNTNNALGTWQSVKFEGYGGLGFGATADYPTLALDSNAVYIGTNDFAPASSGGANSFRGTTVNVIPLNSLFNGGAPTVANMAQIFTPCTSSTCAGNVDRGFAQQAVNSQSAGSSGKVVANSLFFDDNVVFSVNGLTPSSAAGATATAPAYLGASLLFYGNPARQPSTLNPRVIDPLDERISSSVYESQGKIFMLNTVDSGSDFARVHYTVLDASTNAILSEGNIGTGNFDYFQGSIAVNAAGQVVIGYNRSGSQTADLNGDGLPDGNVSFMAQTFVAAPNGTLVSTGSEMLLKVSLTDDCHNGSLDGQAAVGRQRWGDYSQVSIDPSDPNHFWAIGEFAREFNDAANGHPGGTGGSRWGTYIVEINAPVPEPSSYAMMVVGLAALGLGLRRRRGA